MHGYRNDPAQRQLHETPDYEPTVWLTPSKKLHSVKTRPEHVRSWGVGGKGKLGGACCSPCPSPLSPLSPLCPYLLFLVPVVPVSVHAVPIVPVPVVEIY